MQHWALMPIRLTQEATSKEVIAIPIEATAIGNIKLQINDSYRIYNDGSIIVVDGIYDGHQYKTDRINHLLKWIKTKQ